MINHNQVLVSKLRDEAKVHFYELSLILSQIENNFEEYDRKAFDSAETSLGFSKKQFDEFFAVGIS